MRKLFKNNIFNFCLIGLGALLIRLYNIISIGDQFYANLLSDASTYRLWASKIAAGIPYSESVFPMGPLYPYFLAFTQEIGITFYTVLFVQALLGAVVVVLIGLISKRIYGVTAGYATSTLTALYAPFIFYDGLLLSESLQIFLVVMALYLLIQTGKMKLSYKYYLVAGFLLGLAALGRGTILLFPILLIFYNVINYFRNKSKPTKIALSRFGILIIGIIIGIAPATIHNLSHGDTVLISSNFGINFFIGNNQDATGAYDEPSGLNLSSDFTGRKIAEKELGKKLKSSEISDFWFGKSLNYIKNSPGDFLYGLLNKLWLYFWYFDIPQAESIHIQKDFSRVFFVPFFIFGAVLIFSIIGFVYGPKDRNIQLLIILFLSNLLGAIIFFVVGRFRLIGAIPLLVMAGGSYPVIVDFVKSRNWRKLGVCSVIFFGVVIIAILPRSIETKQKIASAFDNVGIFYYFTKQFDTAEIWYRKALDKYPDHPQALNNLGAYFYAKGNIDSSKYYFNQAINVDPESEKSYLNLGKINRNMGQLDSARYYFEKARDLSIYGTDAKDALFELDRMSESAITANGELAKSFDFYFNLAEQYSANGNYKLAEINYSAALKIRPDDVKALNNIGFTFQAQGKYDDALIVFTKVLEIDGENGIIYNNLASVLYRMNNIDSSIVLWEKALSLNPGNAQFINNLNHAKKVNKIN